MIDLTEADEKTVIAAERFKSYKMNGWLQKDLTVASLMDEEFTNTGASRMVPAKLKKDGNFDAHSKVINQDELKGLHEFLQTKMVDIGNRMTAGETSILPYNKDNKKLACTFCPFESVCQFDPTLPGNDYRDIPKLDDAEALQKMMDLSAKREGEK